MWGLGTGQRGQQCSLVCLWEMGALAGPEVLCGAGVGWGEGVGNWRPGLPLLLPLMRLWAASLGPFLTSKIKGEIPPCLALLKN